MHGNTALQLYSVTSLADRLQVDFALIHKDSSHPKFLAKKSQGHLQVNLNASGGSVISVGGTASANASPCKILTSNESIDAIELDVSGVTLIGDATGKVAYIVVCHNSSVIFGLLIPILIPAPLRQDDIIDNPQSFLEAAQHLVNKCQAKMVYIVATHGILSGDALDLIEKTDAVHGVWLACGARIFGYR